MKAHDYKEVVSLNPPQRSLSQNKLVEVAMVQATLSASWQACRAYKTLTASRGVKSLL